MIIIPLFNIGSILYNNISKFFIKINNKFLIEYCMESIKNYKEQNILFILSEEDCNNIKIDQILKKIFNKSIIKIINKSVSVLDTIQQCEYLISDDDKMTIYAPPFTYFEPKFDYKMVNTDAHVVLIKTNNPIYCYVGIDNKEIINLKEKQIISNHGLVGIYFFKNKSFFNNYLYSIKNKEGKYLSNILKLMVNDKISIGYNIIKLGYTFSTNDNIEYIKKKILRNNLIIGLSCDHSGYDTKCLIIKFFESINQEYIDYGSYVEYDCDYNDFITNQYNGYINNEFNFGISVCRSGQGVNISANHSGFRAALIYDIESMKMAIEHNNANLFCLSERLINNNVYNIISVYESIIKYKFLGGRFLDRLIKIDKI